MSLRLLTSCYAMKLLHGSLRACRKSATHSDMCQDISRIGSFAFVVARLAHQLVTQGCDGAPVGSAQLRSLLARPLLHLLGSPLLDLLARMQHVPVSASWDTVPAGDDASSTDSGDDAASSTDSGDDASSSLRPPWGLVPLHQMPETMQPDADDAKLTKAGYVVLQPRLHQPGRAQRAGAEDESVRRGLRGAILQRCMPGTGLEGRAQAELRAAEGQEGSVSA